MHEQPLRSAGLTLVELAITMATGSVVVAATIALFLGATQAGQAVTTSIHGVGDWAEGLHAFRVEMGQAKILGVSPDGAAVTYSVPVPATPGGGLVDSTGEITWGARDSTGEHVGGHYVLSFVLDDVVSEQEVGADFNGDGDILDVFEVGHIGKTTDTGETQSFPRMKIVLQQGDHGGDLDGDGVPDPVFAVSSDGLVEMRLARILEGGGSLRVTAHRVAVLDSQ